MDNDSLIIECVAPQLEGGRHAIKRELGDSLVVAADIFQHGHDILGAALRYRHLAAEEWTEVPLEAEDNDRWSGRFRLDRLGEYEFTIVAWVEVFESWRRDTQRKQAAGQSIASDLIEGAKLLGPGGEKLTAGQLLSDDTAAATRGRAHAGLRYTAAGLWRVLCERERARFGSWYEMFPRSQGTDPSRSATWAECEARLPEIRDLGFDVLYLPPIHPIGHTHRKGRNNALVAASGEPGSPYAIGSEAGGHDAIEPSLGTLADFDHFVAACVRHGLDVALDFAINCSPDHPYVREHPEWFYHRPDGSIKYAENPPKRYEDIYPLNFDSPEAPAIERELLRVLLFWAGHGVRIFRVDNPHTKPLPFWERLLARLRDACPDLIFLSEAFTRPKPMKYLAKIGFSQSYTYFTWRNTKAELTEYVTELALGPGRQYFRPNFFVNTPDILPEVLQRGGRPAFLLRLVLAATLAPSYGMYNGYELCENRAVPGTEEYLDSEKYQFKVWDWERPGNIKPWVARLNQIRREHPALQRIEGVRFLRAENEATLLYARFDPGFGDLLVIAVNLDPFHVQEGPIEIPIKSLGMGAQQDFAVDDLLAGPRGVWRGSHHHLRLDPQEMPAVILRLRPQP